MRTDAPPRRHTVLIPRSNPLPLLRRGGLALGLALGLAVATGAGTAGAAARFVSKGGSDFAPGTIGQPWRTIDASIGKLHAGDTLYVRAGQYFERPEADVSGSPTSPIVIRSYPGEQVVIDSGYPELQTPGNAEWELVNAATGEYRSKRTYAETGTIYGFVIPAFPYENERVALVPYAASVHFRATTDQYNPIAFYVGPGTLAEAGRIHVRLAKTSDLVAAENRYGTVFASDRADPSSHAIVVSRASSTVKISGAYLVLQGLVIHPARASIEFKAGAHDVRIENSTVWMGDRAIEADEPGIHHVTVTGCRLYGDHPYWVFWSDMKDPPYPADLLRATTVELGGGTHDWEISFCHVRGSGQDLIGTGDAEYNLSIHHNRFENAGDDALELEGGLGRTEVFENFFLDCLTAVAPGQTSPTFVGPLFVYRNVMCGLRNPPVNRAEGINGWNGGWRFGYEYVLKQNGSDYGTRDTHVYHNTMVLLNSDGLGMNLTPRFPEDCRIANNLCVTVNGPVNGAYLTGAGLVVDGNLYWKMNTVESTRLVWSYDTVPALRAATGLEEHGLGSTPRRGTDPRFATFAPQVVDRTRSRWELQPASERVVPADLFLGAASPARNAGIVIPPHPVHGVLPDSRVSRDLGAIPYGTPASAYSGFPFNPGSTPVLEGPPPRPPGGLALLVTPHPVVGRAVLQLTLPHEGPARIELLDLQGRRVRTVLDAPRLAAGTHAVALDPTAGPAPLAPGMYFYRLTARDGAVSGRILIAR